MLLDSPTPLVSIAVLAVDHVTALGSIGPAPGSVDRTSLVDDSILEYP